MLVGMNMRACVSGSTRTLDLACHSQAAAVHIVSTVGAAESSSHAFLARCDYYGGRSQALLVVLGSLNICTCTLNRWQKSLCVDVDGEVLRLCLRTSSISMPLVSMDVLAGSAGRLETIMKPPISTWMQLGRTVVTCER